VTSADRVVAARVELAGVRPDLLRGYDAALPGARAQVLSRLLGALAREPLPGVAARDVDGATLRVSLGDGRVLRVAGAAAAAFADPADDLSVDVDGTTYRDPAVLLGALGLPGAAGRLAGELAGSVANLAVARAAQPAPHHGVPTLAALAGSPDGTGRVEQYVVDGHPLHPCCRTRGAMSVADVLAYAPEHRPVLRLHRLRVPGDRWYGDAAPVLLVHPWQAERLRDAYPWLTPDGVTPPMRPLMSLRTLAPVHGGEHVKTAVDVQMTSAVRTVSPAAVHNGPRLSALLVTLTAGLPLQVLTEHGAGAVIVDGAPHRSLAHLRRAAPVTGPGEIAVPLAALGAASPYDGRPLLAEVVAAHGGDPYAWFSALTGLLLPPMLAVLHRGVALEAHGQNTLVVLRHGRAVRVLYRDLGGVRVSAARLRAAGVEVPAVRGDVACDDPQVLRTKLAAALIGTVLAEQVVLLGRHHGAEPGRLWGIAAGVLRAVSTADAFALLGGELPVKATTAMRLAADPLRDVWAYGANPMAGLG
jgi:siderophore synthetase component